MRLNKISNEQLEVLNTLTPEEEVVYIDELICKYYPFVITGTNTYQELFNAYKASIKLEYLYRTDLVFQSGFRTVYTNTGLIRNVISDIYYTDDDLTTH